MYTMRVCQWELHYRLEQFVDNEWYGLTVLGLQDYNNYVSQFNCNYLIEELTYIVLINIPVPLQTQTLLYITVLHCKCRSAWLHCTPGSTGLSPYRTTQQIVVNSLYINILFNHSQQLETIWLDCLQYHKTNLVLLSPKFQIQMWFSPPTLSNTLSRLAPAHSKQSQSCLTLTMAVALRMC